LYRYDGADCMFLIPSLPLPLILVAVFPGGQAENILKLELDLPERTTREYEEPLIAPNVAAALEAALRDEDEIQVDASGFHSSPGSWGAVSPAGGAGSLRKPKSG